MQRTLLAALLLLFLAASAPALAQPGCSTCGVPIVGRYYRMPDGRTLCPADYDKQLPRCTACGAKITGSYVLLDGSRPVCQTCHKGFPGCFVCSLPVVRGGKSLSDGRQLCQAHARQAILDPARAAAVLKEAEEAVVATFGQSMRLRHPIDEVKLVDAASLAATMGRPGASDVLGMFRARIRGTERRYTVFFVSGLPRERLLTVASHEYAHAWHSEHHPRYEQCSDRFREGFAEWVAFRVNKRLGRKAEIEHLLAQEHDTYIEGLRSFLDLERREGIMGALQLATTKVRL